MRLFVGLKVPPETYPAITKAASALKDALGVKMLPPGNWHITLKFLGDADEKQMEEVVHALECVKFTQFEILLIGAGAFPNPDFPRSIWIGGTSIGCVGLAAKISESLSFLKLPHEKFSIHLTVARAPKSVADIEDFLKQNKEGEICSFTADRFQLIKSTLTPAGSIYEVINEFKAQKN